MNAELKPGTAELQLGNKAPSNSNPGWHSRGYLPHLDADGLIQHITFHLADSLPKSVLNQLERSIAEMPDDERNRRRRERYQTLLDAGHGRCVLRNPEAAVVVQDALLHFDGEKYRVLAWVVMPNHVHVLIELIAGYRVSRIVQSRNSCTARRINSWLSETGECRAGARRSQEGKSRALWQRDYWDRYIRDERHLMAVIQYIEENPIKAGLVRYTGDWPWGSCRLR